jgi:hypothetical protein
MTPKRPRDPNQLAKSIIAASVGQGVSFPALFKLTHYPDAVILE